MIVPPQTLDFPGAPAPELQLQQAGFDLTVAKVERLTAMSPMLGSQHELSYGVLDLLNVKRATPPMEEIPWSDPFADQGGSALLWTQATGSALPAFSSAIIPIAFLVTYNETITVPPDCAGMVLPRSSLMRCGAVLHSALWDPGYSGKGQGLLVVYHPLKLYRNARIAQFVLWRMEQPAAKLYEGQYQGENL